MKHSISFRLVFVFLFSIMCVSLYSQQLSPERKVNWNLVDENFSFTYPVNEINFLTAGAVNDGTIANDALLNTLLSGINSSIGAVIYFPAGTYLFNSPIVLKSNIVLKGESAETTNLIFNLGGSGHLISVVGSQTAIQTDITFGVSKDNAQITISDASLFQTGDLIKLTDNDASKVTSDWALGTTGQVVEISAITGNTLTLKSPVRRKYDLSDQPKIIKIIPIENVGVEKLTITRNDATVTQTSNIEVFAAINCSFNCIKSFNSNFSHISIGNSTNCKVIGSYFKDAFNYGDGGQGYGVVLKNTTGECLVYNNIFVHLRHSVLIQSGANGNVISYNYSSDPYWTDPLLPSNSAGDLVLHGNWPYSNLFEGNIVQNIIVDNSHGKNGPFNTFNRNRGELYGIFMNDGAGDSLNFISNEVVNNGFMMGLYMLTGTNHFEYGNNVKGTIFSTGTNGITPASLYLNNPLIYYDSNSKWPPIGNIADYNTYIIESKDRFLAGNLTECLMDDTATGTTEMTGNTKAKLFSQHQNSIRITNSEKGDKVMVMDATGRILLNFTADSEIFEFSTEKLSKGFYICVVLSKNNEKSDFRFINSVDRLK